MLIYKIENIINKKIYIGQTSKLLKYRISDYKTACKLNSLPKHRIIQAMRKHGFDNFVFEILEDNLDKYNINDREIYWISFYNSTDVKIGYNVSFGGKNVWLNDEIREKIMASKKNIKIDPESYKRTSATLMGHEVSLETREKISKALIGKPSWNKGNFGVHFSTATEFKKGNIAPNKGRKKFIIDGKIRYLKINN